MDRAGVDGPGGDNTDSLVRATSSPGVGGGRGRDVGVVCGCGEAWAERSRDEAGVSVMELPGDGWLCE